MLFRRNLLSRKRKYLHGLLLLPFIALICIAFGMTGSDGFDIARREILLHRSLIPKVPIKQVYA